jgi:hypothetical protein
MRTSAQKFSSLYARIEKEISRTSDRARRARNFASISRSLESALEAIVRGFNLLRQVAIFSHHDRARSSFSSRSKKYFRSH